MIQPVPLVLVVLVVFACQAPALRPLVKYGAQLPDLGAVTPLAIAVFAVIALAAAATAAILRPAPALARLLALPGTCAALLLLLVAAVAIVYPVADGLKVALRGSDQDDAIIVSALNLWHGLNPYAAKHYLGNPTSPGPGWIALHLPFVLARVYWLAAPMAMAFAAVALRQASGGWSAPNRFLLIAFSSLGFWEVSAVGSDFPTFGALLVLLLCLADRWSGRPGLLAGLALVLGAVATARVVFLFMPVLFGFLIWQRDRRAGVLVALVAGAAAAALHAVFWYWDPALYTPVHVIGLGDRLTPLPLKLAGLAATAAASLVVWRRRAPGLERWLALSWLSLAVPLAFVAFGDLIVRGRGNPAAWEGANYLIVPLPLLAAWVALRGAPPATCNS